MSRTSSLLFALLTGCGGTPAPTAPGGPPLAEAEVPAPAALPAHEDPPEEPLEPLVELAVTAGPVEEPGPVVRYTLRRGETLAHFSRWSGLTVEAIAEASGRGLDEALPVGAEVLLPIDAEVQAAVERRRDAHHQRRADGYLAARGGAAGSEFYTVRTGDSAWTIARDHAGIPVWLVETYNPAVDLERLRPGQQLMLPILGDTVAQGD